ncbi:MAG TPA: hypothetical protein VIU39_12305 [Anaerolineales bacterium]
MSNPKSSLYWFFLAVLLIAGLALIGPEEQSLGANVRIVYLHGAWVLTAEIAFLAAALAGLAALVMRSAKWHAWSAAFGRAGIVFWVTYLPLSLWAMQSNWNGLFLAEPRFRLAMTFAIVGLLMQAGLWIVSLGWLTSAANVVFLVVLRVAFSTASNVMHPPPSPIFNSGNYVIIGFFIGLNLLAWLAGFFLARWFHSLAGGQGPAARQVEGPA